MGKRSSAFLARSIWWGRRGTSGSTGDDAQRGSLNQSPFYSGAVLTSNFNLSDDAFRTLIFAKALANISDGSIPAINQLLLNLFPRRGNCYVTDGLRHDREAAPNSHFTCPRLTRRSRASYHGVRRIPKQLASRPRSCSWSSKRNPKCLHPPSRQNFQCRSAIRLVVASFARFQPPHRSGSIPASRRSPTDSRL